MVITLEARTSTFILRLVVFLLSTNNFSSTSTDLSHKALWGRVVLGGGRRFREVVRNLDAEKGRDLHLEASHQLLTQHFTDLRTSMKRNACAESTNRRV